MRHLFLQALLGALCAVALIGCGPGRGDLTGTIAYQGKPLQSGTITVLGADGTPRSGLVAKDGTYTVPDIQAGPVKAAVTSADPAATISSPRIPGTVQPKAERGGWFPIPDKYGDWGTSELTYNLSPGPNTWNIDLK